MELDHFKLIIQIIEAASELRMGALLSNSELRGEGGNTASYFPDTLSLDCCKILFIVQVLLGDSVPFFS